MCIRDRVLAIGTVVDDAIVVVEAVQARFDVGYQSSYMATNDATKIIMSRNSMNYLSRQISMRVRERFIRFFRLSGTKKYC